MSGSETSKFSLAGSLAHNKTANLLWYPVTKVKLNVLKTIDQYVVVYINDI